jgi:hypothetical protein
LSEEIEQGGSMDDGAQGWNCSDGESEAKPGQPGQAEGDTTIPAMSGGVGRDRPDPLLDPKADAASEKSAPLPGADGAAGDRDPSGSHDPSRTQGDAGPTATNDDNAKPKCPPPSVSPPSQGISPSRNDAPSGGRPPRRPAASGSSIPKSTDKPNGPTLFRVHSVSNFLSTSRIPQHLDTLVAKCLERGTRLDHILIHGGAGSGTDLLARALIKDYAPRRVVEIDAALGCDADLLRRSIDDAGHRGVLFIRYLDALESECDQMLAQALMGRAARSHRPRGPVDPTDSEFDREIAASAKARERDDDGAPVEFTLVATAHVMPQVGYIVRTRIEHLFHLRDDPKALRNAVIRALRQHASIAIDAAALPQLERVLKTLADSAEPIVRAALLRCACDDLRSIDAETMRSIIEEDVAARLPDEAYSSSLRRHLAGRKIELVTAEEVARIALETGWGTVAAEAALGMMVREDARRRTP